MTTPSGRILIHDIRPEMLGDGIEHVIPNDALLALSARAVLLAEPGDIVIVDQEPETAWLRSLELVGVRDIEIVVPQDGARSLAQRVLNDEKVLDRIGHDARVLEPYMGSASTHELARRLGVKSCAPPPDLTNKLNSKSSLNQLLERAELPIIPTITCTADQIRDSVQRTLDTHGSSIVRAELSIGGHGVWSIDHPDELTKLDASIKAAPQERWYLVQPKLGVVRSPNVQFRVSIDGAVDPVGASDQSLTPSLAFIGNTFPSGSPDRTGLVSDAARLVEHAASLGYRGYIGVDFIETVGGDRFVIEINPRVNTSTFAHALRARIGAACFELMVAVPCECDPADLFGNLFVDPSASTGVVPITPRPNHAGRIDLVALAPDQGSLNRLTNQIHERSGGGACTSR